MTLYSLIKLIHVSSAILSVTGFSIRGILKMSDSALMHRKAIKVLPHIIDTVLLLSAITLVILSRQYPAVAPWVAAKIIALIGYIVVGTVFMRFARKGWEQLFSYFLSLLMVAYIIAVELSKSPAPW